MIASTFVGELSLVRTSCLGTSSTWVLRSILTTWLTRGYTQWKPGSKMRLNLPRTIQIPCSYGWMILMPLLIIDMATIIARISRPISSAAGISYPSSPPSIIFHFDYSAFLLRHFLDLHMDPFAGAHLDLLPDRYYLVGCCA